MATAMAASQHPQTTVSLHPLASRDGHHSSTIVSVQVPAHTNDGLPNLQEIQESLEAPGQAAITSGHPAAAASAYATSTNMQQQSSIPGVTASPASNNAIWGIEHKDIDVYPIIEDEPAFCTCIEDDNLPHVYAVEDAPPIRAMTATQFAELHARYNALDVPHNVVFPFLHGVDGSNPVQNAFFKAPPSGQPTPSYRGLTIVRADMPTQAQRAQMGRSSRRVSSSASKLGGSHQSSGHSRNHSMAASSAASCGPESRRSSDEEEDNTSYSPHSGNSSISGGHSSSPSRNFAGMTSASSASISTSSVADSEQSREDSLFSDNFDDSHTSITTSNSGSNEAFATGATTKGHRRNRESNESYDPQPDKCLLNSTLYPYEIVMPPVMVNKTTKTAFHVGPAASYRPNELLLVQSAQFFSPKQPQGVNLRNFKIQASKYATISDIVIYCPAGYHEGVLTWARWFREAQESLWEERREKHLGGLRYNVFVVTEPWQAFEKDYPHLVAVDSQGYTRNRVDFVDREREEMQRLTTASAIDDNVWLGCSADVPSSREDDHSSSSSMQEDGDSSTEENSNPNNFAVCIECHDAAEVPDANRLEQATGFLDNAAITSDIHALHQLEEEQGLQVAPSRLSSSGSESESSPSSSSARLSLGPSGWNPTGAKSKLSNGSSQSLDLTGGSNSVVHMECSSLTGLQDESQIQKACQDLVSLCEWIKGQAQPRKVAAPVATSASVNHFSHGILAGAFRSVRHHHSAAQNGSRGRSNSSGGSASPISPIKRSPRRILLHCGDGYTETSLIALAYMMYAKGLSLPEAYLDLQNRAKRSFFVYARDVAFLKKLEQYIVTARRENERASSPVDSYRPRSKHSFSWLNSEEKDGKRRAMPSRRDSSQPPSSQESNQSPSSATSEQSVWARGLAGLVSAAAKKTGSSSSSNSSNPSSLKEKDTSNNNSDPLSPPSRALTPTPASVRARSAGPSTPSASSASLPSPSLLAPPSSAFPTVTNHDWFYDARFEGAFPSRILPFLYLGNLNHALNPAMLHALGITHVVSVGESALHPPAADAAAVASASNGGQTTLPSVAEGEKNNSLLQEANAGRISVLDLKNVSDDGIDPLRSTMREAVEYIEAARRSGGSVLVHCRVGVSRSTTIVLAYAMAHLDLSLVESYLLVRSRRLSILIQPHLLFFWELRGWETFLAGQKLKRKLTKSQHQGQDGDVEFSDRQQQADEMGGGSLTPGAGEQRFLADHPFALAALSLQGPPSQHRNASSSPSTGSSLSPASILQQVSAVGISCGFNNGGQQDDDAGISDLDVDIGAGAGSPYGFKVDDVEDRPFGSGSPGGIKAESLRLTWGYLCREVAALNERYF